jgi:uncharacterized protein with HEPN domain
MPLNKRELSYLWDMQNAAREINEFMIGVKFAKFEKNKVLRYAAEHLLLIIGEAANHLSPNSAINILKFLGQYLFNFVTSLHMNMGKVC